MTETAHILIVDDERPMREGLAECLHEAHYRTTLAGDVGSAIEALTRDSIDLVITDLVMEPRDGMELLEWTAKHRSHTPVIMMTGYSTVGTAVEAMRRGAFDYVPKPFQLDEIRLTVQRALKAVGLERENRQLRRQLEALRPARPLIGDAPAVQSALRLIDQIAPSDIPVLIVGETGTGKELLARELHRRSLRASGPFLSVNCAALPQTLLESELFGHVRGAFTGAIGDREGLFEAASGGTLFLDEIGEISPSAQASLLRVLQDGEIRRLGENATRHTHVRVLAATNCDLMERIRTRRFREDLYYRLNVGSLAMPPLRDRREDILKLAEHFLCLTRREMGLSPARISENALAVLRRHDWPGNVRELENVMKRAAVVCRTNTVLRRDLPPGLLSASSAGASDRSLAEAERRHIADVLASMDGNISQAARVLNISRPTLRSKLLRYGISR
jgi:DNA-binding NtrC family response regulator